MQVVRIWDGNRFCVAVIEHGRKLVHAVVIEDAGVRKLSFPLIPDPDQKEFLAPPAIVGPLPHRHGVYPLGRACRKFLDVGRRAGITESARAMLKEGLEVT